MFIIIFLSHYVIFVNNNMNLKIKENPNMKIKFYFYAKFLDVWAS